MRIHPEPFGNRLTRQLLENPKAELLTHTIMHIIRQMSARHQPKIPLPEAHHALVNAVTQLTLTRHLAPLIPGADEAELVDDEGDLALDTLPGAALPVPEIMEKVSPEDEAGLVVEAEVVEHDDVYLQGVEGREEAAEVLGVEAAVLQVRVLYI